MPRRGSFELAAMRRAVGVVRAVQAVGFQAWNRRRIRQERDSEPHRQIDEALGLTEHRNRGRWPTFYLHQIKQLEALLRFARYEAYARRGGQSLRFAFLCHCETCGVDEELRGARRAIAWLNLHGRHTTYERGVLVRADPSREIDEEQAWSRKHGKEV